MHGRVTLQSISGSGCVFTITVPLSLTSTQGLLLEVGQSRYVLPIDAVQRILTVAPRDVQMVEGRAVMMLDHRPVLLVPLADLLAPGHQPMPAPLLPRGAATTSQQLALLIGNGDRQIACMVGAVLGEQSLIVQRLPFPLQHVRFIAGATIMADGNVVPILDSVDILRAALGSRSVGITQVAAEAPARHATILVADDSITTRTLERNILESVGYRVRLATNGEEAYTILQEMLDDGGCDLLLSDVDMPHLNGFDLVRRVREDARCLHLPVVLVTSLDTAEDRERGIAAGADAYIVKRTFDQQTLLDTIARLV
jgi:two-component system chemotaxis sensor kinase CheA